MLSSVLHSKRAVQVNIQIMRTFVKLREIISSHKELAFVPEELLRLIVYHELLHLKIKKHNLKFKEKLKDEFPDYNNLEKQLMCYSFVLSQIFKSFFIKSA